MRTVSIVAAFLLVAGVFCGGQSETPAKPAEQPSGEQPTAVTGVPDEAFAELTKAEMDKYVKALPGVADALEKAGYKSQEGEETTMYEDLVATIEGMKAAAGAEDAVKKAGLTWDEFKGTTYRVMFASGAMGMELAAAMIEGMAGDAEEAEAAKEEMAKEKAVFDKVPKKNQEMVVEYMDQLDALEVLED